MRWLLDTDACIAVLRGEPAAVEFLRSRSPAQFSTSTITCYELLSGAEKSARPARERKKVDRLLLTVSLLPFDRAAADEAAAIRVELERRGTPIGPYDLLIAGHARHLGLRLLTNNLTEFRRVDRLDCETWRSG